MNPMKRLALILVSMLPALASSAAAQTTVSLEDGFFSKNLYPIFQKANCRGCHAEDGVASATRLHFPPESATTEQIEAFGRSLAVLVNKAHPEESLLLKKPTYRIEHTGGKLIPPGSDEEKILLRWINYLATFLADSSEMAGKPGESREEPMAAAVVLRRLTHSQYNNTVRDLLGDQTRPANQFPEEDFVNGFKNQAAVQTIPPLLAEAYSAAAEQLAENAYEGGYFKGLGSCQAAPEEVSSPTGTSRSASAAPHYKTAAPRGGRLPLETHRDAACSAKFIRSFGLRAFRRPLTESEGRRYSALFSREAGRTGDPAHGAQIVVEAMLQSPNFLFRVERASGGSGKQYELASRLSYFLWDTMPDGELLRAAAAGRLATRSQVEREARRMLRDPRAHQALDQFVSEWLRFDRLLNTVRDRRRFPEFTSELAAAMTEETRRLVADLVWNDRNFMQAFTADYGFLNSDLARLYGFPAPAEEFALVKFPPGSDRAGIPGEATFLALTSKPAGTSPTGRGLFVREQFLCQKVPNPPPGTNMNLPVPSEMKPLTTRERLTLHRANENCARCHSLIDPIGFGLERFDAIGKRREKESIELGAHYNDHREKPKVVELDLDPSGVIRGIPDSQFSSPKELGRLLAATPTCQECVVKQLFRYAFGRPETPADRGTLESAEKAFRDSQFRFKELMIALIKSDPFSK